MRDVDIGNNKNYIYIYVVEWANGSKRFASKYEIDVWMQDYAKLNEGKI